MTHPTNLTAYLVELEVLDRAIADEKGIRVNRGTFELAQLFRARLHYARRLDRERTKESYQPGDPGYGISPYDCIICRIRQDTAGKYWVYLEKNGMEIGDIESLSVEMEYVEPKKLTVGEIVSDFAEIIPDPEVKQIGFKRRI